MYSIEKMCDKDNALKTAIYGITIMFLWLIDNLLSIKLFETFDQNKLTLSTSRGVFSVIKR